MAERSTAAGMFLRPGLTPDAATRICMGECKAMCCRGPQYLRLSANEVGDFAKRAESLGIKARIRTEPDGSGHVRFPDHDEDCCPMLDQTTWGCRIYDARPRRCREFPDMPRPGCAISGGDDVP